MRNQITCLSDEKSVICFKNINMTDLNWYQTLIKPALTPPDGVFAPAWVFLYISIIVALLIFITVKTPLSKKEGYIFFGLQMLFNILWTPAFFVLHKPVLALCVIIILDIFTFLNIRGFYKCSKLAGILLIPYFLWLLFATYLNAGIVLLN